MSAATSSVWNALTLAQAGLVAAGVLAVAIMPPSDGPMALVALDGSDASQLVASAIAGGALVLGRGPRANMLIVRGNRAALSERLLARRVILVAAPASWCGPRGSAA